MTTTTTAKSQSHECAPAPGAPGTTDREAILTLTVRYLEILRERYGLRPADFFLYGWSDEERGANFRRAEFCPYRSEEPYAAYFEAIRALFQLESFGGWSFGLVQDDPGPGPRVRGARGFVGWEKGGRVLQFYNLADAAILSEVRWHLRRAFAGKEVAVQVYE